MNKNLTEIKFGDFDKSPFLTKQRYTLKLAYVLQNFPKIGV